MKGPKTPKRKNALGRGLGALLHDSPSVQKQGEGQAAAEGIGMIPINTVDVNPYQPRTDFDQEALEELAESIRIQGVIQPITVRKLESGKYQLISGERRLQASKKAGLEEIPAYIRTADDQQMLEMALIENIQRQDLNAIEVALSYQRLISECHLKQEELGDRVGKKRTTVNNYLRLLRLPPDIQAGLRDAKISMGHARALINIENVDTQLTIYKKIVEEDLSVRKVEALVREIMTHGSRKKEAAQQKKTEISPEIKQLQSRLSSHFGTKIQVNSNSKHKGEIKIPFMSLDDLNRILEILEG